MSKRKLSDQQKNRIAENQQKEFNDVGVSDSLQQAKSNGRVISHYGQQVEVEILHGVDSGSVIRCHQRANLPPLVTGDFVLWEPDTDDRGVIVAQSDRRNVFGRPDAQGQLKPVAANLDYVLIVFAVVPQAFLNLVDRYLVAVTQLGLEPIIVLNKIDLLSEEKHEYIDNMLSIYRALNYPVFEVSALEGDGISALEELLKTKTTVLVGQSGVGKSSLINRLGFEELAEVGDLSQSKYKGTHTTTTARLYHLRHFDLIDSPGIREFSLGKMAPADVLKGFIELREVSTLCKFRDCSHQSEPDCAVQSAIANGEISADRFSSYQRILNSME
ncbi:MAG: small ribosomal subunit biogenesis GTPase RsgA [Gammaproteobacteria bacterium]|nr:small ribosomal subunit biogenesis GTPase RsgA [Gammaproteobacteria bacterium]MDD9895200.1 small ribosomal subunit biogenesis GTPase RsgA [Gammaproteobacteria bacterium]MDD9958918.1 small ribosomal subunit biogenesis GTPase RsgA [Gammaproteobacteria bacterium]